MTGPDAAITVAISTRNRPDALDRCLSSIVAGARRPAQVVVVDQSDDDRATSVVHAHRAAGLSVVLVAQHARGLGTSQNAAFAHSLHAIVAVIDDDCVADSQWLATIASAFGQRPDLDGVTGRVLPLPPTGDRTFPVSSRTSEVRREFATGALPWEVGSGNNFAVRRAAFFRVGGCDERLGPGSPAAGGVDMDLFHRLVRSGSHILYEPRAVVYHQRQTRGDRKARRPMYGRGMGAAIALWHRGGDRSAASVLTAWMRLRLRQLRLAAARGDWVDVWDEITMLASTVGGLVHGWKLAVRRNA